MLRKKNQVFETLLCMILGLLGVALASVLVYLLGLIVPADVYDSICGGMFVLHKITYVS